MELMKLDIQFFASKNTTFSESNKNSINNTSSVTINISFSANNSTTWFESATLYCTLNGVTKSANVSHPAGASVNASFTFDNVSHDDLSVPWSWSCATGTSGLGTIGEQGNYVLDVIPRETKVTSINITDLESPFSVVVDKKNSDFTDNLTIKLGDQIVATRNNYVSGTEISLTNDEILSIYNVQDGFTSTLKFTITTLSGEVTIGTDEVEQEITSKGTIRLYKDGAYKSCIPMIYKNGTWKKCLCFISKSGTFKKGE